jgi:hypothetical protein
MIPISIFYRAFSKNIPVDIRIANKGIADKILAFIQRLQDNLCRTSEQNVYLLQLSHEMLIP